MNKLYQFVIELRRRRVFRVAGIYLVGAWVTLQVAALGFQSLDIPDRALVGVWIAASIGFPLALFLGWKYEFSTQGITRTRPSGEENTDDLALRKADYWILAALATVALTVGVRLAVNISETEPDPGFELGAATPYPNSIAVLPLDNLTGDPEQAYFVAGMHEALIANLARISGLKVISRTSTLQYQDSKRTAPQIGTELGVANLIEGSVIRDGDRVQVTIQLIDAATDEHIWAENYEQKLTNVLHLQNNIARAIAGQIKVQLTPYEKNSLTAEKNVDPEAYELYLKGRFHWYKFTEANLKLALEYFELAIDKDPDYALAYVGFADALATPAHVGMMPTTQVFPAASQFVQRALELDPELAEAHDLRARIHFVFDWDWDAAERGFRRSISLKPGYPDVHIVYSQLLGIVNRWDESLEEVRAGLDLDPLNPWYRYELALRLVWFDRYDEALETMNELVASQPDFYPVYGLLWWVLHEQNRDDEAISAAGEYFRLLGEVQLTSMLSSADADTSYIDLMRQVAQGLETDSVRRYVSNVDKARVWMHAEDSDRALDFLEEAVAMRESHLVYAIPDPLFRPLSQYDRYQDILRQLNLQ
ncbi:MAG: hypothetical protein OER97_02030 [Gammaproteobacteria bacterium]|nr:hypothetical protein [Gammaproteobacteria bacterium]